MPKTSLPAGITIETIEAFWREAASATYASDKDPIKNEDGSKTHRFEDSEHGLWYEDTWRSVNGYGFGTTLIGHVETGVLWFMQYHGPSCHEVIDGLKMALRYALKVDQFWGCRGPDKYVPEAPYAYFNTVVGAFTNFTGRETIYKEGTLLHTHIYHGYLLVAQN
jgi:hypothetical protein